MAQVLSTNVTVDFSSEAAQSNLRIDLDDRDPSLRVQYMRVFPQNHGRVIVTNGSITRSSRGTQEVTESLYFINSNEVRPSYPLAKNINISLKGRFYDPFGNSTTTRIWYNAKENIIHSEKTGFGMLEVTYDAEYRLYRYAFDGWGCPYEDDFKGPPGATDVEFPYDDALMVVYAANDNGYASLQLDGPDCSYKGREEPAGVPGNLILEIDPDGPPAISIHKLNPPAEGADSFPTRPELQATAIFRLYPEVQAEISVTHGTMVENGAYSSQFKDTKKETYTLNQTDSINPKYPLINGAQFTVLSSFEDNWGEPLTEGQVFFYTEGQTVYDVKWLGPDEYEGQPTARIVQPGQIMITDSSRKVIKVTGIVQVEYTTTYRLFDYEFERVMATDGTLLGFRSADVVASYQKPPAGVNEKQAGSLRLSAPSLKGNDRFVSPDI